MAIPLCCSCFEAVASTLPECVQVTEVFKCALCFGLMDVERYPEILKQAEEVFRRDNLDGSTFVLAVNFPVSQLFRELMLRRLIGDSWNEMAMSPKSRSTYILMEQFRKEAFLRPSLSSDTVLTITFANDEFQKRDVDFLLARMPRVFMSSGSNKRHQPLDADMLSLFTKAKVQTVVDQMSLDLIKSFVFASPSQQTEISVEFNRDAVYIAGRYCKYSRSLPQSPWAPNRETPKLKGNSVSEKVSDIMKEYFRADSTKFIASGREDIDVRMLGSGRPFAVCLVNAKKWAEMYDREQRTKTLKMLKDRINMLNKDVEVGDLAVVTQSEVNELNVGQEDKRKIYTALCYSFHEVTAEMAQKVEASVPVEITQPTPLRVLFRRPLIDRKRSIYTAKVTLLDSHYFYLRIETQAGTYVKEFVHSDFGRTRPSVGSLLGFDLSDGISILELDVEGVDLEWPPKKKLK